MQCSPDQLREIYSDFSTRYDRRILWLERIAGLRKLRREHFQKALGNVLDVATGTGRNYEFFPPECEVTGIDLSQEMLAIAKDRAKSLNRVIQLQTMNAEHIDFPSESFDTVVSSLSLCTIPDPILALKEMSRVCKKNGKILLIEHGPSDWKMIATAQKLLVGDWHVRKFGCHWDREPHKLVEQAGLPIHSHKRQFFGMLHAMEAGKISEEIPKMAVH